MKILRKNNYQKVLLLLGAILFLAVISFILNKIPSGYFVAVGDFHQGVFLNHNLSKYLFSWINITGQGQFNPLVITFPYYFIQWIFQAFGVGNAVLANGLMFFFLTGSFVSFYFATKILFRRMNILSREWISVLSALFYAVNVFTFQILGYSYGYLHHTLIYLFLPLLIVLPLTLLEFPTVRNYFLYSLFFVCALVSFGNLSFLLSLFLFQGLLYLFISLLKKQFLIKRLVVLFVLQITLSLVVIVPFVAFQLGFSEKIQSTQVFGGDSMNFIRATSRSLLNIFFSDWSRGHFPDSNLFTGSFMKSVFPFLLLLPSLGIGVLVSRLSFFKENKKALSIILSFLLVFLILLVLAVRIAPPFEVLNQSFFKLPGAFIFRSPDKIQMYLQLFSSFLIFFLLLTLRSRFVKIGVVLIFFILSLPFLGGGIVRYLAPEYVKGNDIPESSGYQRLVKIPDPYVKASDEINKDPALFSVVSLPYSVVNSLNWSNYPRWNFVGNDVISLLMRNPYISANTYDHSTLETKLSFHEFNQKEFAPETLLDIIQNFGGKYIFYHKDIDVSWQQRTVYTRDALSLLMKRGDIALVDDTSYFTLYKVSDDKVAPFISAGNNEVKFERINPTKYHGYLRITDDSDLTFLQSFSSQWKIFLLNNPNDKWCDSLVEYVSYQSTECRPSGQSFQFVDLLRNGIRSFFDDQHSMMGTFANNWNLKRDIVVRDVPSHKMVRNSDGSISIEFVIYFVPQTYMYYGIIIIVLLVGCMGTYYFITRRRVRINHEV